MQHSSVTIRNSPRVRSACAAVLACAFCMVHPESSIGVPTLHAQAPNFMTGFSEPAGTPSSLRPDQLKTVSFKQRLNQTLPLDTPFKDEFGRPVTLGKYFGGPRP